MRNQFVFWLSFEPEVVPTAYLTISEPLDVATSSGWAARRPVMIIRAKEFAGEELKDRAVRAGTAARERRLERIACMVGVDWVMILSRGLELI